jgi:hypothetical protein
LSQIYEFLGVVKKQKKLFPAATYCIISIASPPQKSNRNMADIRLLANKRPDAASATSQSFSYLNVVLKDCQIK